MTKNKNPRYPYPQHGVHMETGGEILLKLNVGKQHAMYGEIYTNVMRSVRRGELPENIITTLNASGLMRRARIAEALRQEKAKQEPQQHQSKPEPQPEQSQLPPPKPQREPASRVDMRDVIAYLAERERNKFTPAMMPNTAQSVRSEDGPTRRKGKPEIVRLTGKSMKFENPRMYDIPNMRSAENILRERAKVLKAQRRKNKTVVKAVPAVELVPEIVQESQPASQIEQITVKPEPVQQKQTAPALTLPTQPKRKGHEVTVISRPDQSEFAVAVRRNCFDRCVITGASLRQRTEAAHLVEHKGVRLENGKHPTLSLFFEQT